MNLPTINSEKRQKQADIERKTAEFLAKGGKVKRSDIGETKSVDLTFRHYGSIAKDRAA